MNHLVEEIRKHWLIATAILIVSSAGATYGIINAIHIEPMRDDVSRKNEQISELKNAVGLLETRVSNVLEPSTIASERNESAIIPYPTYTLYPTYTPYPTNTAVPVMELETTPIATNTDIVDCVSAEEPQRIDISNATVDGNNEYSSSYGAQQLVDKNFNTYWSSKSGRIFDITLNLYLSEPSTITTIEFFVQYNMGSHYSLPQKTEIIYLDKSGSELHKELVSLTELMRRSDGAFVYELSKVICDVNQVRLNIVEPEDNSALYVVMHEIRVYD